MSDELLSKAEIDSLQSARDQAPAAAEPSEPATRCDRPRAGGADRQWLRTLQRVHERCAGGIAASLSTMLRTKVVVELAGVRSSTLGEFARGRENPTCLTLLNAEPLAGTLVLDISLAIAFPIIDRLLGGGREVSPPARRPLTAIELRLVARVTRLLLEELRRAWASILPLTLSVERVESDPRMAQAGPQSETAAAVGFEVSIGEARGSISLCIPRSSTQPIARQLAAGNWADWRRQEAGADVPAMRAGEHGAVVAIAAELAETTITAQELRDLEIGDIITTRHRTSQPATVAIDGVAKFLATVGQIEGRKAVLVREPLGDGRLAATPDS